MLRVIGVLSCGWIHESKREKKNVAEHQGEKNFGTLHVERGEQGKPLINHCFHFYLNKSLLNIGTGISCHLLTSFLRVSLWEYISLAGVRSGNFTLPHCLTKIMIATTSEALELLYQYSKFSLNPLFLSNFKQRCR